MLVSSNIRVSSEFATAAMVLALGVLLDHGIVQGLAKPVRTVAGFILPGISDQDGC